MTAAQAVHTVGKEEHEATLMADGLSDDATNPGADSTKALNVRNRPAAEPFDPATDPHRQVPRGLVPNMIGPDAATQGSGQAGRPGPPVLVADAGGLPQNARRMSGANLPTAPQRAASPMDLDGDDPRPGGDTSPGVAYSANSTTNAQLAHVASSNKTVIAIVGVGLALVLTLVGVAVALRPPAKGLLLIEVPSGASGQARVSLDGKDLTEPDGSPIKDWPQVREVTTGKHTVLIKAPGYEVITETVDVQEGNEPTVLKTTPKKKSAE